MDIIEKNLECTKLFLEKGLEVLKSSYDVKLLDNSGYEDLSVSGMKFNIQHYSIEGVGHLQTMEVLPGAPVQMATFTLTPYTKNLPMLSCDYMYTKENRVIILEVYELVADREDPQFRESMTKYQGILNTLAALPSLPSKPYWADSIRPVYVSKAAVPDQDELTIDTFVKMLDQFVADEKSLSVLDDEAKKVKHDITAEYVENLVKQGGVSTDMWKAQYGEDFVREFFRKVFFGLE